MRARFWFALAGMAICSVATLVVMAGRGNSKLMVEASAPVPEVAGSAQRPSEAGPVQMIRYVVFDRGIYPRELTVDKGLVQFVLEDKTNSADRLVIERVVADRRSAAGEIRRAVNHSRGRGIVSLTPGHYEIYEASRPANKSILTVKP